MRVCRQACVHVGICVYVNICVCECMHAHVCMCLCVCGVCNALGISDIQIYLIETHPVTDSKLFVIVGMETSHKFSKLCHWYGGVVHTLTNLPTLTGHNQSELLLHTP